VIGLCIANSAPVAQLDRASAFEAEGRGFEPLQARHLPFEKIAFLVGRKSREPFGFTLVLPLEARNQEAIAGVTFIVRIFLADDLILFHFFTF
jgi:hypothetical protein